MQPVVRRNLVAAACFTASSFIIAALLVTRTVLPFYLFLPIFAAVLELIARLYDLRILGRFSKRPSETSSSRRPQNDVYTWQQLAAHNHQESAWIAIHGRVYDVTHFVDRHPGGRELLLLAVGRDATDLFTSYHPFTDRPAKVLERYAIGSLATFEHPVYKPDSGFYKDASDAVKRYFETTGYDSKAWGTGFIRMLPVYVVFFAAYYGVYVVPGLSFAVRALLCVLMGACQGMPLTGWMHDASHASIGRTERWWWNVGRFALDYVSGSSMLSWRNQHVIGHHVYTNVMGADPDLPVSLVNDPRRLVPQQVWARFYRWQHIYLPPLYGILGIKSRMQDLTEVFSRLMNGPIRVNPIIVQDYLRMVSSKAVWAFYRIVVPLALLRTVTVSQFWVLLFVTEMTTGYWLAFNFQVSHISSDADFLFSDVSKRESGKCPAVIDEEWAHTQIKTTVDYAHNSPLAAYFSGALNYQTVHHLFPTVSQYHYPAITPIVMEVAKKHGLEFNVLSTFKDALGAHVRHLKDMGEQGKCAELKLE
ncbi:Delta(5) fatty acid desaturase A [Gracilariopsis chorda]|uniref:Delta(5) fatty acid desaturase A n=1 Tax=Gracilariopsis chorda TaxID=448386 RepID=A0A2V3IJ85_9FLOR|nr:Delta(5) fatty acid desaturase A [Gracilariopsis chorda]|eukprot:PXF42108.1 Delta(5) fatty acid desaturase A [Gracilariopsis chorda]